MARRNKLRAVSKYSLRFAYLYLCDGDAALHFLSRRTETFSRKTEKGFPMMPSGRRSASNSIRSAAACTAAAIATALLVSITAGLVASTRASAKPEFAAQTGLPCGQCHANPAGGGKLKPFGEKFKENGFKVKK
jgi:hypothetical protein